MCVFCPEAMYLPVLLTCTTETSLSWPYKCVRKLKIQIKRRVTVTQSAAHPMNPWTLTLRNC